MEKNYTLLDLKQLNGKNFKSKPGNKLNIILLIIATITAAVLAALLFVFIQIKQSSPKVIKPQSQSQVIISPTLQPTITPTPIVLPSASPSAIPSFKTPKASPSSKVATPSPSIEAIKGGSVATTSPTQIITP